MNFTSPVPPSIRSTGPAERSVVLHKPISLECISSGIPPPSITWIKDGRPVDTTQDHLKVGHLTLTKSHKTLVDWQIIQLLRCLYILQLESAGRILKVTAAQLEDSGKYTCLATNAAGEAQQHIRLSVHGNLDINTAAFQSPVSLISVSNFFYSVGLGGDVRELAKQWFLFFYLRASQHPLLWRDHQPDHPVGLFHRVGVQGHRQPITWWERSQMSHSILPRTVQIV